MALSDIAAALEGIGHGLQLGTQRRRDKEYRQAQKALLRVRELLSPQQQKPGSDQPKTVEPPEPVIETGPQRNTRPGLIGLKTKLKEIK